MISPDCESYMFMVPSVDVTNRRPCEKARATTGSQYWANIFEHVCFWTSHMRTVQSCAAEMTCLWHVASQQTSINGSSLENLVIHHIDTRLSFINRAFLGFHDQLKPLLGRRRINKSKDHRGNDEETRCLLQNGNYVSIRGPCPLIAYFCLVAISSNW